MSGFRERLRESAAYKWWVLGFVMVGTFMAVLDITVVNVGMPAIMSAFRIGLSTAEWVITAYMITMTVMLPTAGWLADRFGNKRLYIAGLALFTLGSWLCGRAWSDGFLIFSRALQGMGSGIIQSLGLAIVTREFPAGQRGTALGVWSVAAAASISFGPLLGGFLVDEYSWHLIFDVNVPVGLLGIAGALVIQKEWKNPALRRFDWPGFVCAALFMPLTIYGLSRGNAATNPKGWEAPEVIGSFAVGGAALVLFIFTELKTKHPLLNIRLVGERNFGLSMAVLLLFGIGMLGGTYLVPLYLQNGLGWTAIMAGSVFLPVGVIQGILSTVSGILTRHVRPLVLVFAGVLVMAASFWVASRFTARSPHGYILLMLYLRGFGMGLTFAPLNLFSLRHVALHDMAAASGIANSIKQLSGSVGIALLTAVMTSRTAYHAAHGTASKTDLYIAGITDDFRMLVLLTLLSLAPFLFLLLGRHRPSGTGTQKSRNAPQTRRSGPSS
ncbi:DHA2 family efflux MFS transporter permease subunit [Gallalistipes aquisgranensis]|uniref:DHA2 family efflux MFS transporter permease subunit n=1 Tax=Gallalistipes aquisgranensis TaxID=2779358 RepID=UPI001CF7FA52|nr:DHA2 family efflux MFS transporter permease subunit [Gallalistipes aquisgranensis]MBE5032447.1 DHA2 family efflux MFS transporter permease subunit [Gallalistipes aquisgranensis]